MIKRFFKPLLILACGIALSGCGHYEELGVTGDGNKYCDLTQVTTSDTVDIYVDKTTGVLYMRLVDGVSPIYKADGTLKTIDEYKTVAEDDDIVPPEEPEEENKTSEIVEVPRDLGTELDPESEIYSAGAFFSGPAQKLNNAFLDKEARTLRVIPEEGEPKTYELAEDFHFYVIFYDYKAGDGSCEPTLLEVDPDVGVSLWVNNITFGNDDTPGMTFRWEDKDNQNTENEDGAILSNITLMYDIN